MTTLQAPIDLSSATRVGPRTYRKQVLAKRTIDYPMPDGTTQRVTFDDEYLRDLAAAYNDGAYDLVPFQLATPRNEHNEDPRNYGGRVLGAEVTPDGLDLILELSEEAAELVEKTGGKLGVSARIKPVRHVDGRVFKRAIRHVLGTLDPRMQNLRPWEPVVDLANEDDGPVIDLTGYPYRKDRKMPRMIDLSNLTDEQAEALESFAALTKIDLSEVTPEAPVPDEVPADAPPVEGAPNPPASTPDPNAEAGDEPGDEPDPDDQDQALTDDELEALIDAELANVELSNTDDLEPTDLAAAILAGQGEEAQVDLAETTDDDTEPSLRFQLAAQNYARKGVPPYLIDLAEPILSLSDAEVAGLDLSSPVDGEPIDVAGIVKGMLDAVANTVDLSAESGYGHETEPDDQVRDLAGAWTEYLENN